MRRRSAISQPADPRCRQVLEAAPGHSRGVHAAVAELEGSAHPRGGRPVRLQAAQAAQAEQAAQGEQKQGEPEQQEEQQEEQQQEEQQQVQQQKHEQKQHK